MKGDGGRQGDSMDKRRRWQTEVALSKCLGPSSNTDQFLDTRFTPYGAVGFQSVTHKTMIKSMTLLAVPLFPLQEKCIVWGRKIMREMGQMSLEARSSF